MDEAICHVYEGATPLLGALNVSIAVLQEFS